jgi:hypothetical protein
MILLTTVSHVPTSSERSTETPTPTANIRRDCAGAGAAHTISHMVTDAMRPRQRGTHGLPATTVHVFPAIFT